MFSTTASPRIVHIHLVGKDLCFTNSTAWSLIQMNINFLCDVTRSKSQIKDESLIYFTLLFLGVGYVPTHAYNKYLSIYLIALTSS